jgi:hypothetical protein
MTASGQSRPKRAVRAMSAISPIATELRHRAMSELCSRTHLPAANSIMSRLSHTIDLRGFNWQAFCSKGQQIGPSTTNAVPFSSYILKTDCCIKVTAMQPSQD